MRRALAVAFLSLTLPALAAVSGDSPYGVPESPDSQGKLKRIVRPDFPQAALARGAKATIDVEGVVDGTGYLRQVRYQPVSGDAADFVPALQAVVPAWEFNAPLGDDCLPSAQPVKARVEFEVDGGKPRIFVTQPSTGGSKAPKPTYMIAPAYPRAMEVRGAEANVFMRARIDDTGHVVDVSSKVYPMPMPSTSRSREIEWGSFVDEASRTLRMWTYPSGSSRVACQAFTFRLPR